jgi:hypothetical protein
MNQRDFVSVIEKKIAASVPQGVISQLTTPSGRSPSANLVRLSKWFNSLKEADKASVGEVAALVSYAATFDFLCILDGVTAVIEEGVGHFELSFVTPTSRIQLEPGEDDLHDLFSEIVPRSVA